MASLKDFIEFAAKDENAKKTLAAKIESATIAAAKECGFALDLNAVSDDQLKGVAGAGCIVVDGPCKFVHW